MKTQLLLAFTFILLATSCKKNDLYQLNENVSVEFENKAYISLDKEDLAIEYVELVEESRCPPEMACVWAGQVAVKIRVNNDAEYTLGMHQDYEAEAFYGQYLIKLESVTYNKDRKFGVEDCSNIEIRVTEL